MGARHLGALAVAGSLLAFAIAPAHATKVTFLVIVPPTMPDSLALWISGDLDVLGAWNGAGVQLAPGPDRRHVATVVIAPGTRFEYKVTRGTWATVEKDAKGREVANRVHTVHATAPEETLRIEVAAWRDQTEGVPQAPTYSGTIVRHALFKSEHVSARDVLVYLPPAYAADSLQRYPVVYFQDGQNVFDATTSTIGVEWGVDEVAERGIRAGTLPAFIAVAIYNSNDRMSEYTAAPDPSRGGGHADRYAAFMIDELKTFVDSVYRTLPDSASTGVVGSSLGGVLSLYLGLEHPEVFGLVGGVSPSVWFAGSDILRRAQKGKGIGPLRVWLDMGTREGGTADDWGQSLDGARQLAKALHARGYRENRDFHYQEFEGAEHSERAWARRVEPLLKFLLAPPGR